MLRNGEYIDLKVTPLSNPPEGRGAMGIVITYPMVDYPFFEGIVTAARVLGKHDSSIRSRHLATDNRKN